MSTVCLDASFVLDWLLPTSTNPAVDTIWRRFAEEAAELVGPPLLHAEATSGLRRWVYVGRVTPSYGEAAFQRFCQIDFRTITYPDLYVRAWQLAAQFDQPRAYDTQYLVVAERESCDFWTTDRRLYNSVHRALPWVRLVEP